MAGYKATPIEQRWRDKVESMPENGCWLWTGTLMTSGYPTLSYCSKHVSMHRWMYEYFNGPIPLGFSVLHKCDVKRCINPEHLFTGTQADNMHDMKSKGRARCQPRIREVFYEWVTKNQARPYCINGHERAIYSIKQPSKKRQGSLVWKCLKCLSNGWAAYRARKRLENMSAV